MKGFTLIELLIVVAIIAILAAIAVPNFLEAQTRSKVARVMNDLRTIATTLESYRVDHSEGYPEEQTAPNHSVPNDTTRSLFLPNCLTTPVAYITSEDPMIDLFRRHREEVQANPNNWRRYGYTNWEGRVKDRINPAAADYGFRVYGAWRLVSAGPDGKIYNDDAGNELTSFTSNPAYDPTNGTVSRGDIWRTSKNQTNTNPSGGA